MLGISYFCNDFPLLAQEIGFHFVLKKVSRFHISYVIWDFILDLCTDVRKTFLCEFQPQFRYLEIVFSPSFVF